jgi:hypothetical protein
MLLIRDVAGVEAQHACDPMAFLLGAPAFYCSPHTFYQTTEGARVDNPNGTLTMHSATMLMTSQH